MSKIQIGSSTLASDTHFFLLEDSPEYQKKLLQTLKALGFIGKVTLAETVEEAKQKTASETFDFFFSDWNLPDGMGIEFLKSVRSNKDHDDKPFLMVTTLDDISNILEATNHGSDGFVVKPYEMEDLVEKMDFALERKSS